MAKATHQQLHFTRTPFLRQWNTYDLLGSEIMFSIRSLPPSQLGRDRQRLGEINIGNFSERFSCYPAFGPITLMESNWQKQLHRLLGGETAVALVHDPHFAWVIYREDAACYVQQRFFITGDFADLLPRRTHTEDGLKVSEWHTTAIEIQAFLEA